MKRPKPEIVVAFEFGFKCAEKGMNLEGALQELYKKHDPMNYFIGKYGPDFLKKLPMYRSAYRYGKPVMLCEVDVEARLAQVQGVDGKRINCSVFELDNFVL